MLRYPSLFIQYLQQILQAGRSTNFWRLPQKSITSGQVLLARILSRETVVLPLRNTHHPFIE